MSRTIFRPELAPNPEEVAGRKLRLAEATVLRLVQERTGTVADAIRAQAVEAAAQHALLVALLRNQSGPRFRAAAERIRATLRAMED